MANSRQILAKISREAKLMGLTVNSESASAIVIENGSNDLTVSYVAASIQSPMGGVDPSVSPFLGVGIAAPGAIKMKSAVSAAGTIADVTDTLVSAKLLAICAGFANDIVLENSDASFSGRIRGHGDLVGMGS
jgi:hypothetical protein